jgi:hypothetical protein
VAKVLNISAKILYTSLKTAQTKKSQLTLYAMETLIGFQQIFAT